MIGKRKGECPMKRLIGLLLILALVLTGCAFPKNWDGYTAYPDMEYQRPDIPKLEAARDAGCAAAADAMTLQELENRIWEYYDLYNSFYTNYNLAYIKYCTDMSDLYWQEEYGYCDGYAAQADAGLDALYRALAASPYRERLEGEDYFGADFFDAYEGESLWDETFLAYLDAEADLQNRYYDLRESAKSVAYYSRDFFAQYAPEMGQVFLELVQLRQEMAAYLGYGSYPEFAYDFYYSRDYTPKEAIAYFEAVGKAMPSLYRRLVAEPEPEACTPSDAMHYLRQAAQAMGGSIAEAFSLLSSRQLHHILPGENKFDISFEVYLDSYREPFIFIDPEGTVYDKLTLSHEFGHFVNDYLCGGSYAGTDIAEIHSQAMEYLTLCYSEESQALTDMKLADSICVYVEQSAYALFEHQVYSLTGDQLTLENIEALYARIGMDFGFESREWDYRDYVLLTHLFTYPMYMASYVASNDVAFQIYQKELAHSGAGLKLYEEILTSQDSYLIAFTQKYGLKNPFDPGRVPEICQTLDPLFS